MMGKLMNFCEMCGLEFKTLRGLGTHIGMKHIIRKEIITPFKCEICEKEFETIKGLKVHIGILHTNRPYKKEIIKEFKCGICEREFEKLNGLSNHISQSHKNEITLEEYYLKYIGEKGKCKECGKDSRFMGLTLGYQIFCSISCSSKNVDTQNKSKETYMKKQDIYFHLKILK